jgi:hypothetical protein
MKRGAQVIASNQKMLLDVAYWPMLSKKSAPL